MWACHGPWLPATEMILVDMQLTHQLQFSATEMMLIDVQLTPHLSVQCPTSGPTFSTWS